MIQIAEKGSSSIELQSMWRPEYASYMVEGTPGVPYGGSTNYFNTVSPVVVVLEVVKMVGVVKVTPCRRWSTT